jgi:hypothetical protein
MIKTPRKAEMVGVIVWNVPYRPMYWGLVAIWWALGKYLNSEGWSNQWISPLLDSYYDGITGGNKKRSGIITGSRPLEVLWKMHLDPGLLLVLLSSSWQPGDEQPSTHSAHHDILPCLRPKVIYPVNLGLKAWAKINPSSFRLFLSGICHSDKNLIQREMSSTW